MKSVAIIGTGLIGRGWAIVFARAGYEARLFDSSTGAVDRAQREIDGSLRDLESTQLIRSAAEVRRNLRSCRTLAEALDGVVYAQESVPEKRDIKHQVFTEMDAFAGPDTVLGSSCSAIPGSRFLEDQPGRTRCLIAHPANPPHLLPVVELVPTPWTSTVSLERCRALMDEVGQVPVVLHKEIDGFVMNRMQAAVVNEAMALVAAGIMDPEDIDKTMRFSIGMRWSFMGPFETMDLNAPDGFLEYARRYGASYAAIGRDLKVSEPWSEEAVQRIEAARRALLPKDRVNDGQARRDRRLMALLGLMAHADDEIGK
jgi:3-hydroxyacyl-CoA dehydrogenase